jgi:hypothetical protein
MQPLAALFLVLAVLGISRPYLIKWYKARKPSAWPEAEFHLAESALVN